MALRSALPTNTEMLWYRPSKITSLHDAASPTRRLQNLSYAAEWDFSTTHLKTRATVRTSARTILSFTTSTSRQMALTARPSLLALTRTAHVQRLVSAA